MDDFPFIQFESISSTNTYLKNFIKEGNGLRGACHAFVQTEGRGRGRNSWISEKGGVYLSVTFPVKNNKILPLITPAVALKIRDLLKNKFNIDALIKWPNDILVNDKKLAGFLTELITASDGSLIPVVGLGLNLNFTPEIREKFAFEAVSVYELTGKQYDVDEFAREAADLIMSCENTDLSDKENILRELKSSSATLGKNIMLHLSPSEIRKGKAVDIGSDFQLIVESDGALFEARAGDCYHLRNHETENRS